MKQVLAFIQGDKLDSVIHKIEELGVGGVSVIGAQGRGKGDRPTLSDPRGTGRHKARFNNLETIIVIVDDSKTDSIAQAILDAASTGSKGDGKIFISPIEETYDIGTKKSGAGSL